MAPELAAVYVVGLPVTTALSGLHAYLFRRNINSPEFRNIQSNLRKVDLFWSDSEAKIKPYAEDALRNDTHAYFKTVLWLGILCFFLSWIGFFLQLLVMFSIRYIARPRTETRIYNSLLVKRELTVTQVREQISLL